MVRFLSSVKLYYGGLSRLESNKKKKKKGRKYSARTEIIASQDVNKDEGKAEHFGRRSKRMTAKMELRWLRSSLFKEGWNIDQPFLPFWAAHRFRFSDSEYFEGWFYFFFRFITGHDDYEPGLGTGPFNDDSSIASKSWEIILLRASISEHSAAPADLWLEFFGEENKPPEMYAVNIVL